MNRVDENRVNSSDFSVLSDTYVPNLGVPFSVISFTHGPGNEPHSYVLEREVAVLFSRSESAFEGRIYTQSKSKNDIQYSSNGDPLFISQINLIDTLINKSQSLTEEIIAEEVQDYDEAKMYIDSLDMTQDGKEIFKETYVLEEHLRDKVGTIQSETKSPDLSSFIDDLGLLPPAQVSRFG